jgi:rhodanese-related sulfurtransferase
LYTNKVLVSLFLAIIAFLAGAYITPYFLQSSQISAALTSFSSLSPPLFNQALSSRDTILVDVRTTDEYTASHLANAHQADFRQTQNFSSYLDTLNKNANYLLYCRTGIRSGQAKKIMQTKGFTHVADLAGGITAWTNSGLPVVKSSL